MEEWGGGVRMVVIRCGTVAKKGQRINQGRENEERKNGRWFARERHRWVGEEDHEVDVC